jgi:hypothetical protein
MACGTSFIPALKRTVLKFRVIRMPTHCNYHSKGSGGYFHRFRSKIESPVENGFLRVYTPLPPWIVVNHALKLLHKDIPEPLIPRADDQLEGLEVSGISLRRNFNKILSGVIL